ncbi:MAG: hypothetical protein KDB00_24525 [Planctomycetales bacterium]|nr:hypothetical protein [Planctomycetales bacterium]
MNEQSRSHSDIGNVVYQVVSRAWFCLMIAGVSLVPAHAAYAQVPADQPAATETPENGAAGDVANGSESKKDSDKANALKKFAEALDDLEQRLNQQERLGEYGNEIVEGYVSELEAEYLGNLQTLSSLSATGSPDIDRRRREINARQQHLSLLLWQLKRVGTQIAQPDSVNPNYIVTMQKLLSEHRQAMTDAALMKRYQDVLRRASDLSRQRMRSRAQPHSFHFVRPQGPAGDVDPASVAMEENESDADFEQGAIQGVKEPIGNLVKLSWDNGFLTWDSKHWEAPFVGQSLEGIVQQVGTELQSRGVEIPEQERVMAFQTKRLLETPLAMLLFQDLQHIASSGNPPTRSSSTTGSTSRSRFTAKGIEASLTLAPENKEFSVREEDDPARELQVRQKNENELRVSLIGKHIMLLDQAADGSIRWVDIGDEVTVIHAPSFAQLYAKHPDQVETELYPRLEHCGIRTPRKRYDADVVQRVLERLVDVDPQTRTQFSELLAMMDSGSFGERQKAFRELSTNIEKYCLLLAETSDADGRSAEATARLAELRKKYVEQFGDLDDLIKQTGWISDPSYLIGLGARLDGGDATLVSESLADLTGQSFGTDWQRWQAWAKKTN